MRSLNPVISVRGLGLLREVLADLTGEILPVTRGSAATKLPAWRASTGQRAKVYN